MSCCWLQMRDNSRDLNRENRGIKERERERLDLYTSVFYSAVGGAIDDTHLKN